MVKYNLKIILKLLQFLTIFYILVLPKFDFIVDVPSYILRSSSFIEGTIEAKYYFIFAKKKLIKIDFLIEKIRYTYGKYVEGVVYIKLFYSMEMLDFNYEHKFEVKNHMHIK